VTGDIFPAALRSKGIALGTTANWGSNFILTAITPYLVDPDYANLKEKVFYLWSALNLVCVVYAYLEVYETKGLELEVVDRMIAGDKVSPRMSSKWVATQQSALCDVEKESSSIGLRLVEDLEVKADSSSISATVSSSTPPSPRSIKAET